MHHDNVPQLVSQLFQLPDFHQAIRDMNHNINLGLEHTYNSDEFWFIFIKANNFLLSAYSKGSNILLLISQYLGSSFKSFANFCITKWAEHQNKSLDRIDANLRGIQYAHKKLSKATTIDGRKNINLFKISSSSTFIASNLFLFDICTPLKIITKLLQSDKHIGYETPSLINEYIQNLEIIADGFNNDERNKKFDTLYPSEFKSKFSKLSKFILSKNCYSYKKINVESSILILPKKSNNNINDKNNKKQKKKNNNNKG